MAVFERGREQLEPIRTGPFRVPVPVARSARPEREERRPLGGRSATIGTVRPRAALLVPGSELQPASDPEPGAEPPRLPEVEVPVWPGAQPDPESARPEPASGAGAAAAGPADAAAPLPDPEPAAALDPAPDTGDAGDGPDDAWAAADPYLVPALKAAAAARATAERIRRGGATLPIARLGGRNLIGSDRASGVSLAEAAALGGGPFRPLRQVMGPVPYSTTYRQPRTAVRGHLTVPPVMTLDAPEPRFDGDDGRDRGERFRRFRAEVEMVTVHQVDEDAPPWSGQVPVPVGLPLQPQPTLWRRFLRLFGGGDRPGSA